MAPKQSFIFDQYNSNPLVNLICLNLKFLHILHMVDLILNWKQLWMIFGREKIGLKQINQFEKTENNINYNLD